MDSRYSPRIPKQSERLHSFSSTLLDSIYNSFDDSDNLPRSRSQSQSFLRGNPPLPKTTTYRNPIYSDDDHLVARRRSLPPESTIDYYAGLRSSVLAADHRRRSLGSATTIPSDFFYRGSIKPIRTIGSDADPRPPNSSSSAKARGMKLYGDLKRMKQPISPGGKLASFLNSLFSASKKQKTSSSEYSNFSKRPSSSSGRYEKRSVRFCPVSAPPRGNNDEESRVMEKNRIIKNYRQTDEIMVNNDEDEDAESCCSSDLFELEIGVDRFCAELPVYETTRLETNRAIANGRIEPAPTYSVYKRV